MVPNHRKIEALKIVLNGGTLSEAGAATGIGKSQVRNHINRICKVLDLPSDLKYMRSNLNEYMEKIKDFKDKPNMALRSTLIHKLTEILKLNNAQNITPNYLSNLTASQLMSNGVSTIAISEIQEWLSNYELSLKIRVPENEDDIKKVKQAIAILNVFQFDTKVINEQLSHLLASS